METKLPNTQALTQLAISSTFFTYTKIFFFTSNIFLNNYFCLDSLKSCLFCFSFFAKMMTYVQILWVKIGGKQSVAYNGAVEAIYTIASKFLLFLFSLILFNIFFVFGDLAF